MDTKQTKKLDYVAPAVVTFGDAKEMTQNVNQLGGGDVVFSLLNQIS